MGAEETKHDLFLKRVQITIAILAGIATLVVGIYNAKKVIFPEGGGAGELSVMVRTQDNQPLAYAHTELLTSQNAVINAAQTQSDGTYTRKNLASGSYIFKVSKDGFEPQVLTIQINSKQTTDFDVLLRPLPGNSNSGSPLKSALEEVGASWIKGLGKKSETPEETK